MQPQFSRCFSYSIFYIQVFNLFQYFSLHSIFRRGRCHWQTQAGSADPALLAKAAKNAQDLQAIPDKIFHDLSSPQQPAGEQNAATAKNMQDIQDLSAAASDTDQAAEQNSRQIAALPRCAQLNLRRSFPVPPAPSSALASALRPAPAALSVRPAHSSA